MNQIKANLINVIQNPHVSIPAVIGAGFGIAAILWPQFAPKLAAIQVVLNGYGLIAAANTPSNKQNQ